MKKFFTGLAIFCLCVTALCSAAGADDFNNLRLKAEKGDPDALVELGKRYYFGKNGTRKHPVEAYKMFKSAAEKGLIEGKFFLALCYLHKRGCNRDTRLAIKLFQETAEKGFADSQYALAQLYRHGIIGGREDQKKAIEWYQKAVEQNHIKATVALGDYMEEALIKLLLHEKALLKKFEKENNGYKQSSEDDQQIKAEIAKIDELIKLLLRGSTLQKKFKGKQNQYSGQLPDNEQKIKEALAKISEEKEKLFKFIPVLYKTAADAGDDVGMLAYGNYCEAGIGVPQDNVEALSWWQKSADEGNIDALFMVGKAYCMGIGTDKDIVKGANILGDAAHRGQMQAQNASAWCFEHGYGVRQSIDLATHWYTASAKNGFAPAQFNLGIGYEKGDLLPPNLDEAEKWLKLSADQGYEPAVKWLEGKLGSPQRYCW